MDEKKQMVGTDDLVSEEATGVCEEQTPVEAEISPEEEKDRQIEEIGNRLLRLQADFDNFRRRTRQEKEELSQVVTSGIISQLLPVLDNLERGLALNCSQDAGQVLAGVQLVYRQFMQILEGFGVKQIVAVGMQFDPAQHEAVMRVEDAKQPDGLIVEELQKGYMLQSRVLRPSMVKVVSNT